MSFKVLAMMAWVPLGLVLMPIAQAANPDQVQRVLKTGQCPGCDLSGANLVDANLFGANLSNANLSGANLTGANLGSANLMDANLSGAKLVKASLHRALLESTNFSNADLSNAYLRDAEINTTNFQGAVLQGVNLSRTNLAGVDFQGVDLTGANLSGANLVQVQSPGLSSRSDIASAFSAFFVFGATSSYNNSCDRNSSMFTSAEKQGISFAFANLSGAKLQGANLSQTLLAYSNLSGANLTNANLSNAILVCSNLDKAVLDGAELKNARLTGVVLENVSLTNVKNLNREGTFASQFAVKVEPLQRAAKQMVGSLNRSQQAHFVEKEKFAAKLEELNTGIDPEAEQYRYRTFAYADRQRAVMQAAVPREPGLKTYIGLVNVTGRGGTSSVICESDEAKPLLPQLPTTFPKTGPMACPTGFKTVFPY
jgi:uncharacterized protein YjbI with pentapeptide repeats